MLLKYHNFIIIIFFYLREVAYAVSLSAASWPPSVSRVNIIIIISSSSSSSNSSSSNFCTFNKFRHCRPSQPQGFRWVNAGAVSQNQVFLQ